MSDVARASRQVRDCLPSFEEAARQMAAFNRAFHRRSPTQ
jgi:hypothetical protein